MAEEQKASSTESANASVEAANVSGENKQEAQHPQTSDVTPTGTAPKGESQPTSQTPDKYAGLNLEKLPEEARAEVQAWAEKRENDQLRYVTQKAQENADVKKKATYYDQYVNSPEYANFKQWRSQQQSPQSNTPPVTSKFESAGFSAEESAVIAEAVKSIVNEQVQQKEQQFQQQLGDVKYVKAKQDLEDLGRLHPDLQDMVSAGIFKPFVEHYCLRENQPLEVAYAKCKEAMGHFQKQGQVAMNQRIKEKKNAVSATPSAVGDSDILYVEPGETKALTQKRVDDAAFNAALEGRKVRVRVKKS